MTAQRDTTPDVPPDLDERIHCPDCEYNLTGILRGRCPECGSAFDRAELLASAEGPAAPIPIWDEREQTGAITAYLRVTFGVMFRPGAIGRMLPPNPNWASAQWYGRCSYAIAAAVMFTGALASPSTIGWCLVISIGWFVGAFVCENLIALGISMRQAVPTEGATDFFTRARTIACMGSCFLVGSAISIAADFITDSSGTGKPDEGLIAVGGLAIWWWIALILMVWRAHRSGLHALLMLVVVPFAVLVSCLLGVIATLVLLSLLAGMWSLLGF